MVLTPMHAAGILYDKQTSPELGRVLQSLDGAEAAQMDPYQRAVIREARRCCPSLLLGFQAHLRQAHH